MSRQLLALLASSFLAGGCGQRFQAADQQFVQNGGLESVTPPVSATLPTESAPASIAPLRICSKLNLSGIDWSNLVAVKHREVFGLALNISGSFEGNHGFENLTNNFDGQGLSYGLLNQCLGQGSLQPLLIQMRDNYPAQLGASLSSSHSDGLLAMLHSWESHTSITALTDLREFGLSSLDDPEEVRRLTGIDPEAPIRIQAQGRNAASVAWAVANLYNGSSFQASWSKQLRNLASTPGYRSIQTSAAARLHGSALNLFDRLGLRETRSYLFLFDVVVQNGGLPQADMKILLSKFTANPGLSEKQKLDAILTQRLTHVKALYRADVRARKSSIINGTGIVHGTRRDYAKEYCTDWIVAMP